MLIPPIDYQIHDGTPPILRRGKSYNYIMAGNGLFKFAANQHIEALMQLAQLRIVGLPHLKPYARLTGGFRLPENLLTNVLQDAKRISINSPIEAMYHFLLKSGRISVTKPQQLGSATRVTYAGGSNADIVLDLHSHQQMSAFFSKTDDHDELGFRFYAVIGAIFTKPEICLRIGIYGDRQEIPITSLFTGPGPFIDKNQP